MCEKLKHPLCCRLYSCSSCSISMCAADDDDDVVALHSYCCLILTVTLTNLTLCPIYLLCHMMMNIYAYTTASHFCWIEKRISFLLWGFVWMEPRQKNYLLIKSQKMETNNFFLLLLFWKFSKLSWANEWFLIQFQKHNPRKVRRKFLLHDQMLISERQLVLHLWKIFIIN